VLVRGAYTLGVMGLAAAPAAVLTVGGTGRPGPRADPPHA
jgi:hypothetical protein